MTVNEILIRANRAKSFIAGADSTAKNRALSMMADAIIEDSAEIIAKNTLDMDAARGRISDVMLDRLMLNEARISAMAAGIREVAELPDPVWKLLSSEKRPNGLSIEKYSVPFGVVAILYESRPNVTSDAAALAVKSGNVCVLRGGSEAINSARAIADAMRRGLSAAGFPEDAVCFVDEPGHDSARALMTARGQVDLLIPRGGAGLIRACVENATVPVIETGTGICHIYVDRAADIKMAANIVENAKTSRPSVCNAAEVCLVHEGIADAFLPELYKRLVTERSAVGLHPVELRLDGAAAKIIPGVPAGESDYDTEFLDYIMAVKIVPDVDAAIEHIGLHGTHHSDAIITTDTAAAEKFRRVVDSAAVYVNASTRFTDGGEFGLGCEMGISTQKLHARGPMGLFELNTYKYVISGDGQVR